MRRKAIFTVAKTPAYARWMVALRAVLLYTVVHFVAKSVDQALATRFAVYERWFDLRRTRRRRRRQRPLYAKVLRKAAISVAVKLLLDAGQAVARAATRRPPSPTSARE